MTDRADTTAFMQLLQADLFTDFPGLRLVIPHGGGAVPYHWGRFRGLTDMLDRPPLADSVMRNVFFDTCVYHQPGINLLFDDTRRYVDALPLGPADRRKVYETNVRRVYPRLDAALP